MNEKTSEAFKKLIDKMSAEAPQDQYGGFACQLMLVNGAMVAGTLVKTDVEGLYKLVTVMRKGDARTGNLEMVESFFSADLIAMVTVPMAEKDKPKIIVPTTQVELSNARLGG